jgi:hypothetical protein
MIQNLMCTAVLLMGATALRADVFAFSYAGTFLGNTASVTGTLTATSVVPGVYTVTNLSGTRDSVSISDSSAGSGGFIYGGASGVGTLTFLLNGLSSKSDVVAFAGSGYTEIGATGMNVGNTFSIRSVPEPATLSLLFAMGFGVWVLARKLPSKRTPVR